MLLNLKNVVQNILGITKIILINLLIFFLILAIFELFLGKWFKNDFKYKLSSERNIDRVYKLNFIYSYFIS